MQAFRTILSLSQYPFHLSYQDQMMSLGSCFADQLAQRLQVLRFSVVHNPFGILYNPLSLADGLQLLLSDQSYEAQELFEQAGQWHHFDFHGAFSDPDPRRALDKMNESVARARAALPQVSFLVLTLGTAYAWWHRAQDRVVANCHKVPTAAFERRLLRVATITDALSSAIVALQAKNPELQVLCTVSPVRHIRDGLAENQLSKATLRLALQELTDTLEGVHYFPSYEILMDELRDYRFYEADMIHPTPVAIDYIWERFRETFFDAQTKALMRQVQKVNQGLAHRPQFPDSPDHQRFLRQLIQQMEAIEQKHPFLSFLTEKKKLLSYLTKQSNP